MKCNACNHNFEITNIDLEFYDKISPVFANKKYSIPSPTICPDCRQQRRLAWRNERNLYHRKCDLTGKQIISIYSSDKPYKVYAHNDWWGDNWSPLDYGKDFDLSKSFLKQFEELAEVVPKPPMIIWGCENSEFTNHSCYNKNCYLCINIGFCEDCYYCSNFSIYDRNCIDCFEVHNCELCYNCINVRKSFNSTNLINCSDCSDSNFLINCSSCQDCFSCYNLKHKQYCINNIQYTKEEYLLKLQKISPKTLGQYKETLKNLLNNNIIVESAWIKNCEKSSGDFLSNCKETNQSFSVYNAEDSSYCYDDGEIKNCYDAYETLQAELQYETHACNSSNILIGCTKVYESNNLIYCKNCWNSNDLFGCVGMKRKQYCILNKQYTKEEYEALVPKIIAHMQQTGEWGEFFPISISPFGYNETVANEYFPLSKEEALSKGYKWHDEDSASKYQGVKYEIADNIDDVKDDITSAILQCEVTGRPFKIIPQELKFYRDMGLPIPRTCPDQRHKERMALRNPRRLWNRKCMKCEKDIQTTYSPDRMEKVYCEECYLKEVY